MSSEGDRLVSALSMVSASERAGRRGLHELLRREAARIATNAVLDSETRIDGQTFRVEEVAGDDDKPTPVLFRNGRSVSSLRGTGLKGSIDAAGPAELDAFASEIVAVAESFLEIKRERLRERRNVLADLRRVDDGSRSLDTAVTEALGAATAVAQRVRTSDPVVVAQKTYRVRQTPDGPRLTVLDDRDGTPICFTAGASPSVDFTDDVRPLSGRRAEPDEIARLSAALPEVVAAFTAEAQRRAAEVARSTLEGIDGLERTVRRRDIASGTVLSVARAIAETAPADGRVRVGLPGRKRTYQVLETRNRRAEAVARDLAVSAEGIPLTRLDETATSGPAFDRFRRDAAKVARRFARQARGGPGTLGFG